MTLAPLQPSDWKRLKELSEKDPTTEQERWMIRLLLPNLLAEVDRLRAAVAAEREACTQIAYREEMELNLTHHIADAIKARGQAGAGAGRER